MLISHPNESNPEYLGVILVKLEITFVLSGFVSFLKLYIFI